MGDITYEDVKAGQSAYTPVLLRIYDLVVTNFSNSFVWRCKKRFQIAQFNEFMGMSHLDIGVGTGYYLKKSHKKRCKEISLFDLNQNCLVHCAQSLDFPNIKTIHANIYEKQSHLRESFDSISMNYLFHCLPGDMETKKFALESAVDMLKDGGILFGATILSDAKFHSVFSKTLMNFYNSRKIFSNTSDNLECLRKMLETYLDGVSIEVEGCVALFNGVKK